MATVEAERLLLLAPLVQERPRLARRNGSNGAFVVALEGAVNVQLHVRFLGATSSMDSN